MLRFGRKSGFKLLFGRLFRWRGPFFSFQLRLFVRLAAGRFFSKKWQKCSVSSENQDLSFFFDGRFDGGVVFPFFSLVCLLSWPQALFFQKMAKMLRFQRNSGFKLLFWWAFQPRGRFFNFHVCLFVKLAAGLILQNSAFFSLFTPNSNDMAPKWNFQIFPAKLGYLRTKIDRNRGGTPFSYCFYRWRYFL